MAPAVDAAPGDVKQKKKRKAAVVAPAESAAAERPAADARTKMKKKKRKADATADAATSSAPAAPAAGSKGSGRGQPSGKGAGRGQPSWSSGRGRGGGGPGRGVPDRGGGGRPGASSSGDRRQQAGGAAKSGEGRPRRPLAEMIDYLRTCVKSLEEGLGVAAEEDLLAARAVEEMGDRVVLIAADQRGSKFLERLLRRSGPEAFAAAFSLLAKGFSDLAPNQYASHVLSTALTSWAERLAPEGQQPPLQPLVDACAALSDSGGWPALVDDACASHAVRALLLALGGYAPEPTAQGKAAARAGLLPQRRAETAPEVAALRRSVACALIALLREDPGICLSPHASPVVQLLLRILRDKGDRALANEAAAAVLGAPAAQGAAAAPRPSPERCEELLRSAPGSRALEAVLETASTEISNALFSTFFRQRLGSLVRGEAGDFGSFVAQRVIDSFRDAGQVQMVLGDIDLAVCLAAGATAAQQGVAVKLLEACLRLREGFKPVAASVFRALGVSTPADFYRMWPTVLALERLESVEDLLKAPAESGANGKGSGRGGRGGGRGENRSSSQEKTTANDDSADVAQEGDDADDSKLHSGTLRPLAAAGPQIMALLLRFPADAVQPLNSGLPKLIANKPVLSALARESKTARVIEAAMAPSSALLPKNRSRLAKSFQGLLGHLGPHSVGGWVCAALWRASLGDAALRETFAKELLAVEDALRTRNFAVWKVCGLHQAKTRQAEWSQQQQKAGKTKRLFDELLEGSEAAESAAAAKAAKEARERAADEALERAAVAERAALADPMVAGLLVDNDADADALDERIEKKRSKKDVSDAEAADDGEPADKELNRVFATKRKRRGAPTAGAASVAEDESAASAPKAAKDSDLAATLELIAGKAPKRVKKRHMQNK
eukprot:TRINITY_DN22663_c0_g1_i1.p1 TRINITY_DN22663_c0_g1~~TRINITY_DN22663_c0_g1_i1.p1  ORF type:complete len:911 (+),score=207.92 TRINITY_DN22663_c0_g1_i1:35-2734(+)